MVRKRARNGPHQLEERRRVALLHTMLLLGLRHRLFSGPHHLVQVLVPPFHPQLLLLLVFAEPIVQVPVSFALFVLERDETLERSDDLFRGSRTARLGLKGFSLCFFLDAAKIKVKDPNFLFDIVQALKIPSVDVFPGKSTFAVQRRRVEYDVAQVS